MTVCYSAGLCLSAYQLHALFLISRLSVWNFIGVSIIQGVSLATEPGISLIINNNLIIIKWWSLPAHVMMSSHFLHNEVRFKFRCSILISGKIKEMPVSVASGTLYIFLIFYVFTLNTPIGKMSRLKFELTRYFLFHFRMRVGWKSVGKMFMHKLTS